MARGPHIGGFIHPATGERQRNGDPPQSLLAAQLVQQFTDSKKRPKIQDQETFRQLLLEVLGTGANQPATADAHENDINSKLIYVIVKAGLDSLPHNSPFDKGSDLYQQVTDSLAAIDITIKRCPNVLFVASPDQESETNNSVQLFQWLLPRLISFLAKSDRSELHSEVADLVKSCILGEAKLQLTTIKNCSISAYVRGCTRGKFSSRHDTFQLLTGTQDSIQYLGIPALHQTEHRSLPSTETLRELMDESRRENLIDQTPQIAITNRAQALDIATRLLSVVADVDSAATGKSSTINPSSSTKVWVLNAIAQLWQALGLEGPLSGYENVPFPCLRIILKTLRSHFVECSQAKSGSVILSRSSLLLSQVIAFFLIIPPPSSVRPLEGLICLSLLDLAYAGRVSKELCHILDECLLPTLLHVLDDDIRLQALSEDLQV